MAEPWWKRLPGRLRRELKSLRAAGCMYTVDRKKFKAGLLVVDLMFPFEDHEYSLRAEFPRSYPYFEPTVLGLDLGFTLHWNPFDHNICLLGRRTENWDPNWTLGGLIAAQFPKVVQANSLPREQTLELEIDQGEPLSVFYATEQGSLILIDADCQIPEDIEGGWLKLGLRTPVTRERLIGAVLAIEDAQHQPLCRLNETMSGRFPETFWCRWQRMPEFVRENDPAKFQSILESSKGRFRHLQWGYQGKFWLDVTAVIFPEEVRRREYRDGWIFLCHTGEPPSKRKTMPRPTVVRPSLIKAERCGREELMARIPEIAALRKRKVAVVGLGCVGAALSLELAKAGLELSLIDRDDVEFGPSVRWPLGFSNLGWRKAEALQDFIGKQWPYCKVRSSVRRIGADPESDEQLLAGVDLIVDATAEVGVQRYLSDLTTRISKPMILVSSTPGGWGGRIARFCPDRNTEPCFECLRLYEDEDVVTIPPADPHGMFQAIGCGDITFHAAGADAAEISLAGARLVFSTLGERIEGAYPATWWNVATLRLRSTKGEMIEPNLESWRLNPHPKCKKH